MKQDIKYLVESLFDDLYDIDQEDDVTINVADKQNEPIIKETLYKLSFNAQKILKEIPIDNINLLPPKCFSLTNGKFGKKQDVIRKNFRKFLLNLFKVYNNEKAVLDLNFIDTSGLTTFVELFADIKLSTLKIDISHWDTSNVTNMFYCFYNSNIPQFDISNWDVSNVITLDHTFDSAYINCDLSKWQFKKLQFMRSTFQDVKCINFDFSKWNTSAVTDASLLFYNINYKNKDVNIKPEYIENLDLSNCVIFLSMFSYYNGPQLNLNNWVFTNKTKIFKEMFTGISSKTFIDMSDWVNKLTFEEILESSDSYLKKQLRPLIFNKMVQKDLNIKELLTLTRFDYFRNALKDYKIKLIKNENNEEEE